MKLKFTKQLWLFIIFCAFTFSSLAQDEINTEFINRMNYVFSPLEKNRVPNGLLLDYAMEFVDLKSYNGVLTDTNKVNAGLLRDMYATIAMSAIHTNAGGIYSPDYVDSIWQLQRQPGIITLSGLYYNYARLRDDALNSGLITVSNDQVYDRYVNGVWQNPYQTETVFAMSPPLHAYSGKSFQVVLPSNLWFTNNASTVSSIAVDFNDGVGYRTITTNQSINISYADTGRKTWTFRLTLTNNTNLYSHTEMQIEQEPNAYGNSGCSSCRFPRPGGPIFLTADDPYIGQSGQGWITVDYANADLRLRRPLIVVEGFDPGHLLAPERQFGFSNFVTFIAQLNGSNDLRNLLQGNNQQYDIIYVDWFRGTDFLQRNALLLERVIRWVNEQKAIDGSVEPNVVLGQSMGGVISRWALRDMENRGLNHQTRLYISWDAPQQGANVPVAYQHAVRHANSLFMQSAIPVLLGGTNIIRMVKNALNLLDVPAARQMLYNRVLNNGQLSNADHNAWQLELRNLGYPQQSRNVAVSNGSECGIGQGFQPGATLLSFNGRANTRILTDIIGTAGGMYLLSLFTGQPAFLFGIVPGRNDFFFDFQCNAQPEGTTIQLYKGKIDYRKKILWLINVNTTITNRTRNSDPSVLPIDGTPGGMYDTELSLQSSSFQNWAIKYSITASNIPHFNFIPTVSSLDIGGGNAALTMNNYRASYVGANPPGAPFNTPFANFTTAFNRVTVSNGTINNNENHIEIAARNGNFVAEELNGNVNVRTNCTDFCNLQITGNNQICSGSQVSVPVTVGPTTTITWSASPAGIVQFGCSTCSQTTVTGNGTVTLTANITSNCGNFIITKQITIVSAPLPPTITNLNFDSRCGTFMEAYSSNPAGATGYIWNVNFGQVVQDLDGYGSDYIYVNPLINSPQTGQSYYNYISVQAKNACGASGPSETRAFTVGPVPSSCGGGSGGGGGIMLVAPNPATDAMTVQTTNNKTFTQLRIIDKMGNVKKEFRYPAHTKKVTLRIAELPADIYRLQAFDGKTWTTVTFSKQ